MWYVVCFAAGIASYFALPREPYWPVFLTALVILAGLLAIWKRTRTGLRLMMVVFFLAGFVIAKARVDGLQTTTLPATTPTTQITGTIISTQKTGSNRTRIILQLKTASGIKKQFLPARVRLSGKHQRKQLFHSDQVKLRARLFLLPGPVRPRGYDFGRALWFQGIGASGFYYGDFEVVSRGDNSVFNPQRSLQKLRHLIGERISSVLSGTTAGLARALIIGDRSGIDKDTTAALRFAGLAHILAISGLHMSLVAGGSFWLIRALLALSPGLVLNYPIKKWAAGAGLLAGGFYLAISGANIATQRAFIMAAVMFLAILANRPAISMRNVAIAALLILIYRPEVLLGASFQMSFMAVTGLVGWFEYHRHRRSQRPQKPPASAAAYWARKTFSFFAVISATTIVAGVFTGLPGAYHFHNIASYSVLGNIIALPIISLVVMPAAIASILLMPLGLEAVGLNIMSVGLEFVMGHAHRVAALPYARTVVPDLSQPAVLLIVVGLLWLCLWRNSLKFVGVLPVLAGAFFISAVSRPDMLISKFGRNVAIRDSSGFLVMADNRKSRFAAEHWLAASGDSATLRQSANRKGWICKDRLCSASIGAQKIAWLKRKPYKRAGVVRKADPLSLDCAQYTIIVSSEPLRGRCKKVPVRIDRFDLWRKGAHAVYFENGKPRVETALEIRGLRPWVVRPIARRKILINPPPKRKRFKKNPEPAGKKREANLMIEKEDKRISGSPNQGAL